LLVAGSKGGSHINSAAGGSNRSGSMRCDAPERSTTPNGMLPAAAVGSRAAVGCSALHVHAISLNAISPAACRLAAAKAGEWFYGEGTSVQAPAAAAEAALPKGNSMFNMWVWPLAHMWLTSQPLAAHGHAAMRGHPLAMPLLPVIVRKV
jgi:hypothetical protein